MSLSLVFVFLYLAWRSCARASARACLLGSHGMQGSRISAQLFCERFATFVLGFLHLMRASKGNLSATLILPADLANKLSDAFLTKRLRLAR